MLAIWHLALTSDWEKAVVDGTYAVSTRGLTVEQVGFLHAAFDLEQVGRVAAAFYGDVAEPLTLLAIDPYLLADEGVEVRVEPGDPDDPESERFAHPYGPVPVSAVLAALPARMVAGTLTLDDAAGAALRTAMSVREAAYGLITDDAGRLLLARLTGGPDGGQWTLPGGGLEPGETPDVAVVREVLEETGFDVVRGGHLGTDIIVIPARIRAAAGDGPLAGVRHVYRARIAGGSLRSELDGSTDLAAWHTLDEIARLPIVELVDVGVRLLRRGR